MASNVVRLATARPAKPAKRKRIVSGQRKRIVLDPRIDIAPRTFEIIMEQSEGENIFARRARITISRKGGLRANTARIESDGDLYLVGQISESTGHNKWSEAGYGGVPMHSVTFIREIIAG